MAVPPRHRHLRRRWRPPQLSDRAWTHQLVEEPDGTLRLDITDEDGTTLPVARQLSTAQAELLLERIQREARSTRKPIKALIRDPYFMAATVITIKRHHVE